MDPSAAKPFLDLLVSYGLPLIISLGVLALMWRYIPAWIDASIKTQTQVPIELSKLNDTLREGAKDMHKIKQAVKHGASATAKMLNAQASGQSRPADVAEDVRKMLKSLGDEEEVV